MPNESATTVNSTYFPFTRKVVGTAAAATVVVWSPERPRTVNPPPSQPVEAAAPPRLTPRTAVASTSKSVPAVMRQDARDANFGCMNPPMQLGPFPPRALICDWTETTLEPRIRSPGDRNPGSLRWGEKEGEKLDVIDRSVKLFSRAREKAQVKFLP